MTPLGSFEMRSVQINQLMFIDAFERDVDFHNEYPQSAYLDLETGEVIWVFEEDEDAEWATGIEPGETDDVRARIDGSPERYLEIPGRGHGEHHDILREFLNSDWTEDKELKSRHSKRIQVRSVGGKKRSIVETSCMRTMIFAIVRLWRRRRSFSMSRISIRSGDNTCERESGYAKWLI